MLQALGPALLVTAFPPHQRGQALGYTGTIVAAGILTGPVLGLLAAAVGPTTPFLVGAATAAAGAALALTLGRRTAQA